MQSIERAALWLLLFSPIPLAAAGAGEEGERPSFEERVAGLEARAGLLTIYPDPDSGSVLVELPPPAADGVLASYLYVEGLRTGLGSNPVGLDRGQLGPTRVVDLRRVGGRILVEERNLAFRALTDRAEEERATRESFATSVLWAGPIEATTGDGRILVDLSGFLVRDAHGIVRTLADAEQGSYQLDPERSVVDLSACLAFPDNLEFEALLTFTTVEEPGRQVRSTAPDPTAVTLVLHHSLVRLPPPGYRPRRFDPRISAFAVRFLDYAAPLDGSLERRWIVRHRLERTRPGDPRAPVVEPIVYHVDPAIPEPVRGAVLEGAAWWAEAFAAAGFRDAFSVELLPEGAHPLDVRYNVIQWVHRSTRGWSYGGGVIDPRTGEMIKGHVSLGSLRVRQDRLLFEALAGTEATGSGRADDPVQLALARIRQLAAHEVGHTLGFAHNFAASTYGGRASVMDYPAPLVRVGEDGALDFADAYGVGLGSWDLHAANYAYREFPPGIDVDAALEAIVEEGLRRGLAFLSDADARPPGGAEPRAALWDNGEDPVEELLRVMEVREAALGRFGEENVALGTPLALLEEVLATVYFHYRYQVEAAIKVVGGLEYVYAVRGDGQEGARPVSAAAQRTALQAVLSTLAPESLDLPERVLDLILPRPFGYPPNRELFQGHAGPAFDGLAAAATAADHVVGLLLHPARAHRLVDQWRRDPAQLSLEEMLQALVASSFSPVATPRTAEIARSVRSVVADRLLALAADPAASPAVRASAESAVAGLAARLRDESGEGREGPHRRYLAAELVRFLERDLGEAAWPRAPLMPPGSPIGALPGLSGRQGCGWGGSPRESGDLR